MKVNSVSSEMKLMSDKLLEMESRLSEQLTTSIKNLTLEINSFKENTSNRLLEFESEVSNKI